MGHGGLVYGDPRVLLAGRRGWTRGRAAGGRAGPGRRGSAAGARRGRGAAARRRCGSGNAAGPALRPPEQPRRPPGAPPPSPRNEPFTGILAFSCKSPPPKKIWSEENNAGRAGLEGARRGRQRRSGLREASAAPLPAAAPAPGAGAAAGAGGCQAAERGRRGSQVSSTFSVAVGACAGRRRGRDGDSGRDEGPAPPRTAAAGRGDKARRDGTGRAAAASPRSPRAVPFRAVPCRAVPAVGAAGRGHGWYPGWFWRRQCPVVGCEHWGSGWGGAGAGAGGITHHHHPPGMSVPRGCSGIYLRAGGREGKRPLAPSHGAAWQSRPKLNAGVEGGGRERGE